MWPPSYFAPVYWTKQYWPVFGASGSTPPTTSSGQLTLSGGTLHAQFIGTGISGAYGLSVRTV